MTLVDNGAMRNALAAFAAAPGQRRALDVLRHCMYGELLFDITGSDAPVDGAFATGARLQIRGGTGPGGGRALFAFSRNDEIARLHPSGTRTQSMVTPASGALELARRQGDSWLYIDPAGPTCALSASDIDFALRNPRNEALKDALVAFGAERSDRHAVLALLRQDGPLLLSADDRTVPGQVVPGSTTLPDGSPALLAFTSAPEAVSHRPDDAVVALTVSAVLDRVRQDDYGGLVIDPSGPYIALSRNEIDEAVGI